MINLKEIKYIWIGLGLLSILFHIYLIFSGLVPSLISRPLHMALAIPWVFIFISQNKPQLFLGYIFSFFGILSCVYIVINEPLLSEQYGFLNGTDQFLISIILIFITLEMARRTVGWPLPLITLFFLLYGLTGDKIPGEFGHPGIPINSFLGTLIITEGGLWGKLTGVSVSIVAVFVIFGAILNAGEAGQGFMNIAIAAAGRLKGGAAKVSVISSALFGSISGSASANVASTGMVTLPTMIKLGYSKKIAGAVEAVASTGGQIMPPLMGAGAFVMVELTGIPYSQIIIAAFIPALLYFFAIWLGVNRYAELYDLKPYKVEMLPQISTVIKTALFFLIPFSVLLAFMYSGYTPQFSAAIAILSGLLLLFFDINLNFSWKTTKTRIVNASLFAGRQVSIIASIILTAIACLILGMEVPTTAAYVICVSVAGPALIDLGLKPLLVHLFIFWFALLSTITPPVCGGVFIAASMVEENWLRVAKTALVLGLGLYIIPLAMIRHPSLIDFANFPLLSILTSIQIGVGLFFVSKGLIGKNLILNKLFLIASGNTVIFLPNIGSIIY